MPGRLGVTSIVTAIAASIIALGITYGVELFLRREETDR